MATKTTRGTTRNFKLDATRPLYAAVGAGDLAVSYARTAATDVQARVAKVELEPKALRDQAVTLVSTRVEELQADAKKAQAALEARITELQSDAKALPNKLEKLVNDYVAELNKTVDELNKGYAELAGRGHDFVTKVRKQEATQQTKAAAKSTTTPGEGHQDHRQEVGQADHHGRQGHRDRRQEDRDGRQEGHHRRRRQGRRLK